MLYTENVFDLCMKSSEYFGMDNISLETSVCWLSEEIGSGSTLGLG